MKLIVGLGNPGEEYINTRHNVGFMVIDNICEGNKYSKKFNGYYFKTIINDENVIFLKPLSYMNLSGDVVVKYKNYYKVKNEDILVIHDDLDLPLGSAKLKFGSNSGGDNGVKSIINRLNTNLFCQYKIGISNNKEMNTKDYVLGKFNNAEKKIIDKKVKESKDVIEYFINNDIEKTMSYYNGLIK